VRELSKYAEHLIENAQIMDWEDLRYFLALAQTGSLSGAARALRVNHATVSRRVAALEERLQVRLVERLPRSCRLTEMGVQVYEHALGIEEHAFAIERAVHARRAPLTGTVMLSAAPVLVDNFLAQRLGIFCERYPGIRLSLSAEAQNVSLSRREADVAVRMERPQEQSNVVRKLGTMGFALYASRDYVHLHKPVAWEFIVYGPQYEDMPQQRWLRRLAGSRNIVCEVGDITGQHAAARAGVGVAGLPSFLGDADEQLLRLPHDGESFGRELWLIVHQDLKRSQSVRAVMDFVIEIFSAADARIS
jgi:DNA-binding transcriptional LysR family regulator